jgi:hypothetical protein
LGGVIGGIEAQQLGINLWTGSGRSTVNFPLNEAEQSTTISQYENIEELDTDIKNYTGKNIGEIKQDLNVKDISLANDNNLPNKSYTFDNIYGMIKQNSNKIGGVTQKEYYLGFIKSNSSKIWFSPGLKAYTSQIKQMVFNHEFIHAYHFSLGLYDNKYSEASASNYSYFYLKIHNLENQALQGFKDKIIKYPSTYSWKPLAKIFNLGIVPL